MSAASPTVLITGAEGQLGLELQATAPAGWLVHACGSAELDVTNAARVRAVIGAERPDVVIHTAAYTGVDAAEIDAARAEAVNADGAAHVAEAAGEVGARLVHVSTDFVFDGQQGRPYGPEDPPNPLSVYGRTKLLGERAVTRVARDRGVTVRTAWLYSRQGHNFVRTMLRLMSERDELGVVCDQVGTPTWARSLAEALWAAAQRPELHGILHWTDAGVASWYDFAIAIQEEGLAHGLLARVVPVRPLSSAQYPTRARRPSYSVLDTRDSWSALGLHPPHWRVNLRRMFEGLARG